MITRRILLLSTLIATAGLFFALGLLEARREDARVRATYDAKLDAIRAELRSELQRMRPVGPAMPAGTMGLVGTGRAMGETREAAPSTARMKMMADIRQGLRTETGILPAGTTDLVGTGRAMGETREATPNTVRAKMIAEIKQELQTEMGLLPVPLLRERRSSFVEMYAYDNLGKTNYGTAGYLGQGYFITVKHGVVALKGDDERQSARKIVSIKVLYNGKEMPAKLVDAGDADVEVHRGDWAIIKTQEALDIPPLRVDTAFAYDFAEPIFRLGNDYGKGIILSTGYVGQKMLNGLVTCLTDGHPGVSGGGVLDQHGDLVGVPVGRMQGDYRFSFILPVRIEMFRKVPSLEPANLYRLGAGAQ